MENKKKLRALAMYLPQYHPIKENDEWWGKGFTEWRNVVKGTKQVKGQYQPHEPADLGYYDLRIPEIREQQAQLAKEYGIYGFCYYHYWFKGKRMIERPFNEVLSSGSPDFPFCLCWANETWSRNWDGKDKQILIKQEYSEEDDLNHINYLCKEVFSDKRYITVDGKPVLVIYRASSFPDIKKTTKLWNEEAKKMGYKGIYLVHFWSFDYGKTPKEFGTNAAALFTPNPIPLPSKRKSIVDKVLFKLGIHYRQLKRFNVFKYEELSTFCSTMEYPDDYTLFPCVTPMWDNYVRRRGGGATIYTNSTPQLYENWLASTCENWKVKNGDENLVFINAWNEWAEGNHLEPCEKWGHQYLQATKNVLSKYI